jgi:hypothetical protein
MIARRHFEVLFAALGWLTAVATAAAAAALGGSLGAAMFFACGVALSGVGLALCRRDARGLAPARRDSVRGNP